MCAIACMRVRSMSHMCAIAYMRVRGMSHVCAIACVYVACRMCAQFHAYMYMARVHLHALDLSVTL